MFPLELFFRYRSDDRRGTVVAKLSVTGYATCGWAGPLTRRVLHETPSPKHRSFGRDHRHCHSHWNLRGDAKPHQRNDVGPPWPSSLGLRGQHNVVSGLPCLLPTNPVYFTLDEILLV